MPLQIYFLTLQLKTITVRFFRGLHLILLLKKSFFFQNLVINNANVKT